MKKVINIFLIILAVVFSINLQAMEKSKKRSADAISETDSDFSEELETDGQKLHPIVVIINHLEDHNNANLKDLQDSLCMKSIDETPKPIIMVSPSVVSKLLAALEKKFDEGSRLEHKNIRHIIYSDNSRCMNYFEEVIQAFLFVDDPKSHFITLFPICYQTHLSQQGYKAFSITTPEELKQLVESKKNIPSPCKQDFEVFAKICNSIENVYFKALIAGHGLASGYDKHTLLCNLYPKDCSDMLTSFDKTNITSVIIRTCCVGGKNRRFLQNKEVNGSWIPAHYSFNIIVRGVTDGAIVIDHRIEFFLKSIITTTMLPKDVLRVVTERDGQRYHDLILQMLPAGSEKFITYANKNVAIIDEQIDEKLPCHLEKSNNLIYLETTKMPLIIHIGAEFPRIFFMMSEAPYYILENVVLKCTGTWRDVGVIQFINAAFFYTGWKYLPKKIEIKTLQGNNDIQKMLNHQKNNKCADAFPSREMLPEITLGNVKIVAAKRVTFEFTYDGQEYEYIRDDSKQFIFRKKEKS